MNKDTKRILDYMVKDSEKDNLEIRFSYNKMAIDNGVPYSSGFFEQPKEGQLFPLLVIGINKPESQWLEVLLHEYSHFNQWRNQTKVWRQYTKLYKNYDDDKEESKDQIEATVNMESECEQDTIKLAKKLNYNLDIQSYIKKVNAYLLFYQIFQNERKWYKNSPFEDDRILDLMPCSIIDKPLEFELSENLLFLYEQCL